MKSLESPDPSLSTRIAGAFSRSASEWGFYLDGSLESLLVDFERLLPTEALREWEPCDLPPQYKHLYSLDGTFKFDFETGASTYLGEVLARHFGGVWAGELSGSSAQNYYAAYLLFGDYQLRPFAYIGYRVSNGIEDTGSVEDYLRELESSLKDGIDHRRKAIEELMSSDRTVIDNAPWL